MKTQTLLITAAVSYLLFLLILTPAANIIPLLNLPPQKISLNGVSGSLWSGSIDNAVVNNNKFQAFSWSLRPLALFSGKLSADLQTSYASQPVATRLDYSLLSNRVSLNHLNSSVTAEALQKLLNLPFGQLAGNIQVNMDSITMAPGKMPLAEGFIYWNNAKYTLSESISLGQLKLGLASNDSGDLSGKLSNMQGDIDIKGDIKVLANQSYTLDIRLTPRANASTELQNILSLVAPRKINAEHVIQRNGHLKELGIKLQ